MRDNLVTSRRGLCLAGALFVVFLTTVRAAMAFPFLDPTNEDTVPGLAPRGTELPATDVTGLRNQLRLLNPGAAGNPGAWTFIPRLTIQEEFTDNALEVKSPRHADAITIVAPGISILADTSRIKLTLDYQPNLFVHAINGPLNVLTQQLNATGTIIVVPDLAYVDVRALSGVQSRLGALAGTGTLGAGTYGTGNFGTGAIDTTGTTIGQGLNRLNEVQTSSFGISPYLLRQFGDYGTGKLGASIGVARYASISGFAAPPVPAGGVDGQSLLTTEQIAQFTTGQFLGKVQDAFSVDLLQSTITSDAVGANPSTKLTSQRQTVNNQVSYALNRVFTLLGSFGLEHIQYSPALTQTISGPTWNVGVTVTPSPDSGVTVTYGHYNGTDAFAANGHVALTARTLLSFDYSNTIGTQLENIQSQLNASTLGLNGLINAQTGGPAFVASNGLGVQNGVFRYNTFNTSLSTVWDRDSLQAALTWSQQTAVTSTAPQVIQITNTVTGQTTFVTQPAGASGQSSDIKTGSVSWTHLLSPDWTLNSSASASFIRRSNNGGNDTAFSTGIALQYAMSAATTVTARYSFYDRISKIPGYSLYENLLLLGITKQF